MQAQNARYSFYRIWWVLFNQKHYKKMAVKLRLQRHGRKRRPFYHIVATDSRARRDGRSIERIGWYNPIESPAVIEIDVEKALKWLANGAQPTDTVRSILSHAGVLYRKHLLRGVSKGIFGQDVADKKYEEFMASKAKKGDKKMMLSSLVLEAKKAAAAAVVKQHILPKNEKPVQKVVEAPPVVVETPPVAIEAPEIEPTKTEE